MDGEAWDRRLQEKIHLHPECVFLRFLATRRLALLVITHTYVGLCSVVNKCKHWTLCVVVNPGAVSKHRDDILGDSASLTNISEDDPFPCLLFFDSLNAHATENVASTVREWLNSEWIRLMPDIPPKTPFDSVTMRIYSPKGMCLRPCPRYTSNSLYRCAYLAIGAPRHFLRLLLVPYQENR